MARKRLKRRVKSTSSLKERDQETVRTVNHILDCDTVDTAQLRKIAAVRGLANSEVRVRAWPALLGVRSDSVSPESYTSLTVGAHRDSSVVNCDIERSLWTYTVGWTHEDRGGKRAELHRLLTATVCSYSGDVFYYQGLHDIASVLLFVLGEYGAFLLLRKLVVSNLRDCTRSTMEPVMELLGILFPILEQADPQVHKALVGVGLPPLFALPWIITLFSHNINHLASVARLFDLFLASHPLMPLYSATVVIMAVRERLIAAAGSGDPAEVHGLLMKMSVMDAVSADELARRSVALFKQNPPATLLARKHLTFNCAVTVEAAVQDGFWTVPEGPLPPGKRASGLGRQLWAAWQKLQHHAQSRKSVAITTVSSLLTLYFAVVLVSQSEWFYRWQADQF